MTLGLNGKTQSLKVNVRHLYFLLKVLGKKGPHVSDHVISVRHNVDNEGARVCARVFLNAKRAQTKEQMAL